MSQYEDCSSRFSQIDNIDSYSFCTFQVTEPLHMTSPLGPHKQPCGRRAGAAKSPFQGTEAQFHDQASWSSDSIITSGSVVGAVSEDGEAGEIISTSLARTESARENVAVLLPSLWYHSYILVPK